MTFKFKDSKLFNKPYPIKFKIYPINAFILINSIHVRGYAQCISVINAVAHEQHSINLKETSQLMSLEYCDFGFWWTILGRCQMITSVFNHWKKMLWNCFDRLKLLQEKENSDISQLVLIWSLCMQLKRRSCNKNKPWHVISKIPHEYDGGQWNINLESSF